MLNLKWLLKKASTGARVIPSGVEGSQKWLDFPIPRFFPPQADPPVVGALLRMTRKIVFQQPLKGLLPKWFCEENCRFFSRWRGSAPTKILEKRHVGAPSLAYSAVVATATKAGWRELFEQHAVNNKKMFLIAASTAIMLASGESAYAGTVTWDGSASTVWTNDANWVGGVAPATNDDVVIDGNYTNAPILNLSGGAVTINSLSLGENNFSRLTVSNCNSTATQLTITANCTIGTTGTLTHADNSTAETHKLNVAVGGDFTLALGGKVNVNGLGYNADNGPGTGVGTRGAGYGGEGGGSPGGPTYGSVTAPTNLGSGGSGWPGGGAVQLTVSGTTTINGTISAAGQSGSDGGNGSGGSVYITTANLTGSGTIVADGGSRTGGNWPGYYAGGGGRIAVILTSGTSFDNVAMTAYGGDCTTRDGGAGTIYKKTSTQDYGDLIIDNNYQTTTATTLISSNVTGATVGDVTIRNAGKLQLDTNQSLTVHGDWTNNATFTAETNSTVLLAGTNEVNVSGSNTFYNLSSTTSGKIIKFEAGKTNTVNGKLTLNGVTLNSTQEGTWWYLNLVNAGESYQDVSGVTVRDSNAGNGQTIIAGPYPFSKDKGHNVNWTFLQPAGTVFSIQ